MTDGMLESAGKRSGGELPATDGPSAVWRWAVVAMLLAAAALRLWRLGLLPPGLQFDEAHNAIDAVRVLQGHLSLFFPDNGGREPLATYLHAAAIRMLAPEHAMLALRLASAFVGIATVAALHRFAARFVQRRATGALACGFLAASYWHLHFSRYGIRAILAPFWTTAAIWAWWSAIGPVAAADGAGPVKPPSGSRRSAIACGIFLAAAAYSHPSGRLLPLVLLAHTVLRTIAARRQARPAWQSLALAGLSAMIAFAPLGLYFLDHPAQFTAHPSDVSLAAVAAAQHGGSMVRATAANLAAVAGMLFLAGDPSTLHNLPGLPVFDPLTALFAVLGAGVLVAWIVSGSKAWRDRAALLVFWAVVGLLPTVLSDRPPNYSRAMAALPVVVMLPAIGLQWALDLARLRSGLGRATLALSVVALAGLWTALNYFVSFATLGHVFYSYDVDKVQAYAALSSLSGQSAVYVHPLWAEHATFAFLNRDGSVATLDGTDSLVLPADGRPAAVAFPAHASERNGWFQSAESLYGTAAARLVVTDTQGGELLRILRVPTEAIGDLLPPSVEPLEPATFDDALFGNAIQLVGHTFGEARAGTPLDTVLVWRSVAPVGRDLTVFVHLVGDGGESLGQEDREPAHTSYRTSDWQVGDVVIDRYRPTLGADPGDEVTVVVGWYDRATGERLATEDGPDSYTLGSVPAQSEDGHTAKPSR